jgi:hypothetical protein
MRHDFLGISLEVYLILLVLSIPCYFLWRWLFTKFIKVVIARKVAIWTATIILTPLLYIGLMTLILFIMTYYPNREFNSDNWKNMPEKRYELSRDIINNKRLTGKSKAEIKNLLGYGDKDVKSNDWYYDLGYRPELFNIDPSILEIRFQGDSVIDVIQHH